MSKITELYTNVNPGGRDPVFYSQGLSFPEPAKKGWYHFDETWFEQYAHGPFSTRKQAEEACKRYMESLG